MHFQSIVQFLFARPVSQKSKIEIIKQQNQNNEINLTLFFEQFNLS